MLLLKTLLLTASAAKISEDVAKEWLKKTSYMAPRQIPRLDDSESKKAQSSRYITLPHGRVARETLTVIDVASRYKEAAPLNSKNGTEVADALSRIYKRGPLKHPKFLQVDPGRAFMGEVNKLLAKRNIEIRS